MRAKGQVTLPNPVRELLQLEEGDNLIFHVQEGRVIVEREQTIDPEQAWFWTERWQQLERQAQADLEAGRVRRYANIEDAITDLEQSGDAGDSTD
jgi:AbrB family looped-hinge helix DNA binding protein